MCCFALACETAPHGTGMSLIMECDACVQYGAMLQFAEGQLHCGIEMGDLFLEAYLNDGMSVTSTAIEHVCELLKAFPSRFDHDDLVKGMAKLKQGTLKWVVK